MFHAVGLPFARSHAHVSRSFTRVSSFAYSGQASPTSLTLPNLPPGLPCCICRRIAHPRLQTRPAQISKMSYALTNGPFDLNADNGPFITRVSIAMMCVSVVGICGRFLARRLMRQPLLWDDGMIVLALVFAWTCSLIQIIGMISGTVKPV